MGKQVTLTDRITGEIIYPVTTLNSVYNLYNTTLSDLLDLINTEIQDRYTKLDIDTLLKGLFTDLSNTSDNKISITVGSVSKTLEVAYAANAGTLGGFSIAGTATNIYNHIPVIGSDGVIEIGKYIDFHSDNTTSTDYSTRILSNGNNSNILTLPTSTGTLALTSDIPSLSNSVTLDSAQTISGVKTFSTLQKFTVADGTSPFTVTSKTLVSNLNADLLDGAHLDCILYGSYKGFFDSVNGACSDYTERTGFYTSSNFSDKPSEVVSWGTLQTMRLYSDNTLYTRQLFFDCYGADKIWTRSQSYGSWTSWKELFTSANYSSYITKDYITNQIGSTTYDAYGAANNVQVGGRNLFAFANVRIDSSTVTLDKSINGYTITTGASDTLGRISYLGFNGIGGAYTVSFWIKASVALSVFVNLCDVASDAAYGDNSTTSVTTDYVYHKYVFTNIYRYNNSSDYNGFLDIEFSEGTVYVKNIKIERGNKATDWTLAPEDVDANILSAITTSENDAATKYLTLTGNAASATKLNKDITIWGQSFDGTADVNGVLQLSNSGLKFADNAFGGGGDIAKMYLTTKGGEATTMTFEVRNDGDDTINFITPSSTGLTHNNNIILDSLNYSSYALPLHGTADTATKLSGPAHTDGTSGWFRSNGDTGWYNETYGGGIYMADSNYVRTFGNKSFYCNKTIHADNDITSYGSVSVGTNIYLGNHTTGNYGIYATMADSDGWYIQGEAASRNNSGLRIGTYDDSVEYIAVSQGSSNTSYTRTAYLLDANGNTSFPGTVTAPTFSGTLNGTADLLDGYHESSFLRFRGILADGSNALTGVQTTGYSSSSTNYQTSYGDSLHIQGYSTWYNRLDFGTSGRIYFYQAIDPSSTTGCMQYKGTLAFLTDIPTLSLTTSGTGNAVSSISVSGHTITLNLTTYNNYSLPTAADSTLGGVKTGYTTSGQNYKVSIDASGNLYTNVPWANTWNANSVNVAGYVSAPTSSNANKVWKTDANGNPGWRTDLDTTSFTLSMAVSPGTSSITLAFGTKYLLTAGGSTYIFTMPDNPNTNYLTGMYVGASLTTSNSAVTNPYVNIYDSSIYRSKLQLVGAGGTTITSNDSSAITISTTSAGKIWISNSGITTKYTSGLYINLVAHGTTGCFTEVNNANIVLTVESESDGKYNKQLGFSSNGNLYYRSFVNADPDSTTAWKTIIDSGNIGSQAVTSASKLTTAVSIWGKTFDGSSNITGNLVSTGLSTGWSDTWSDGTNTHPWCGYDMNHPNTGIYSTTISDYYGLTLRTGGTIFSLSESDGATLNSKLTLTAGCINVNSVKFRTNDTDIPLGLVGQDTANRACNFQGPVNTGYLTLGRVGGVKVIQIDSNNNVYIGGVSNTDTAYVTDNSYKLKVNGTARIESTLSVGSTITATAFYESSDERLKNSISNILKDDIKLSDKIKFKLYKFNNDSSKKHYGVIALDLLDLGFNNLVKGDEKSYYSVDYISLLILKMQAMQNKIDELTKKINNL